MVSEKPKRSNSNRKKFGVVKRLQKQGGWSEEEDRLLLEAVKKYNQSNWTSIAECVPSRTATQCLHRYRKVLDPSISKSPWTKEEDMLLQQLASEFGERAWSAISARMVNRNAKQIRERYMNHLAPGIKKGVWDQVELDILVKAHSEHGNKWSVISELVDGRSPNACKNQFHAYQQRIKKGLKPRRTKSSINPPANNLTKSNLPINNSNDSSGQKPSLSSQLIISGSGSNSSSTSNLLKITSENHSGITNGEHGLSNHDNSSLKSGIESQHSPMSPDLTDKRHLYAHQNYSNTQVVHGIPQRTNDVISTLYMPNYSNLVSQPPTHFSQSFQNPTSYMQVNPHQMHTSQIFPMGYALQQGFSQPYHIPMSERTQAMIPPQNNNIMFYNDYHLVNSHTQGYEIPMNPQRDEYWLNQVNDSVNYHTGFMDHHQENREIPMTMTHIPVNTLYDHNSNGQILGELTQNHEFNEHYENIFPL